MDIKVIKNVSEVFAGYDAFIIDLWGVVHDGLEPLPHSIEVLKMLKKAKKKICFLSNAPRRANSVAESLKSMGVTQYLYDHILTSGEATFQALDSKLLDKFGEKCLHLGPEKNNGVFEGLDIELVETVAQADFILASGVYDDGDIADIYKPLLKEAADKKIPMICSNPDRIVHIGDSLVLCPGTLADLYAEYDGEVIYYGKPYRDVYSKCFELLGTKNILAIGDSYLNDIKGAFGMGIDSLFISSGIHRDEVNYDDLGSFLSKFPFKATYISREFKWE